MNKFRIQLLAACAVSSLAASAAQAQVALPAVELNAAGATTVGDVATRTLNCVGNPGAGLNPYGTNTNQLITIAPGSYVPAVPSGTNPAYDCATQEIQPDFEGKYIGTGSGAGKTMWSTFATNPPLSGAAGNINPFSGGPGNPSGWDHLQYAFSEAPASSTELNTYNTNAKVIANKAGAAIQVPFFVIPVSVAYNPIYGVKQTAGGPVNLTLNVKFQIAVNGTPSGGLKLSRVAYCKIFNGEITNWNDAQLRTLNSNTSLRDVANDPTTRFDGTLVGGVWNGEGAPIRLVGRADRSGGTDVFTRAMAAQCNGGQVTTNKFVKAAELLPYNNTSTIDIRRLRPDTRYYPAAPASNHSGPIQSLGGLVFDRVSDQICNWDQVNVTTAQCDATVAGPLISTPTPGLFLVADGASGVEEAIRTVVNNTMVTSAVDANIKLNGKIGYVGADFVMPVGGRSLHSAQLQKGNVATGTAYVMPSATNAAAAFGTVFPPQSVAASGAYDITDARTLGSVNPYIAIDAATNPATPISRANPLHWAAALYNPNVAITATLASPAAGYPITGSAFMLTYTCFKPAVAAVPGNNAKRFAMSEYVGLVFGKITKNSVNGVVSANTFKGTGTTGLGIISKSNTTVPSAGWQTAIWETFFRNSTQDGDPTAAVSKLGTLNLWVQDAAPTTASDVDAIQQATDQKSNSTCDANFGA